VACLRKVLPDAPADVGLRAAREPLVGDGAHDVVGSARRVSQAFDLRLVLDRAQGGHDVAGLDELRGIERGAQAKGEPGPHLVLHRDA
jgi:hypothetical protein